MLLDISKLKNDIGGTLPFEVSLDLSEHTFGGCHAASPVHAVGTVRNTAGVYVLSGTLETTLEGLCDRCAKPVTKPLTLPLEAVLAESLSNQDGEEDPWLFLLDGWQADLDEIIRTTFVLRMDTKYLCKEDCRGLCPRCGRDLNLGDCGCKPEPDPRFAVLKQLLQKEQE